MNAIAASLRLLALLGLALLLISRQPAWAGTRIVFETTTAYPGGSDNATASASPRDVTLLFQADKIRVETDSLVVIYDLGTRKVSWLDPARKTYSILPLGQLPHRAGNSASWGEKIVRARTEISLKIKTSPDSKPVSGLPAVKTVVTATLKGNSDFVSTLYSHGVGSEGGLSGVSIPTGPGGSSENNPDEVRPDVPVQVVAEYWLSHGIPTLSRGGGNGVLLWPVYALTLPQHRTVLPLLDQLTARMDGMGFPVSSRVAVRLPSASDDDLPSVVVTTRLRSTADEPFDRSLFIVPAGYRQLDSE